jgi:hypothetical protein
MTEHSPFDHTPDPAMGEALRTVLPVSGHREFVHRVLERVGTPETWWEVLGMWARPAVAAALLLVAIGGFFLGRLVGPADVYLAAEDAPQVVADLHVSTLFGDSALPDVEALLGDDRR